MRSALTGDRAGLDEVMRRLACVVRFVFRLNKSLGYGMPTEALEDVTQQVYLAVWPRLPDFAGTSALETWVFGFCRNCLRAEFRRRAAWRSAHGDAERDEAPDPTPAELPPGDQAIRSEGLDILHQEIEQLDAFDREVVELRHLQDWSFEQIARQKNMPTSTVKDRCYRALDRIRTRMTRRYGHA